MASVRVSSPGASALCFLRQSFFLLEVFFCFFFFLSSLNSLICGIPTSCHDYDSDYYYYYQLCVRVGFGKGGELGFGLFVCLFRPETDGSFSVSLR